MMNIPPFFSKSRSKTKAGISGNSGSISFELISRGCRNVTAIEKNNAHASFIAKVAKELKTDALALIRGDVFRYLNSAPKQSFDFIFADPPYALPELP